MRGNIGRASLYNVVLRACARQILPSSKTDMQPSPTLLQHNSGVRVLVPATSANLGPGFDVLGLALRLHNTFTIVPSSSFELTASGCAEGLPLNKDNLFYRAFSSLFRRLAPDSPVPDVRIEMSLAIPPGRGLGSSATAVVGGLAAANALLGSPLTREDLLPLAVDLEAGKHADNVAPALLGGLTVSVHSPAAGGYITLPVPFPDDLCAVLLIPAFQMDTVRGRALMPSHYTRADTVHNTSRVALLLSALQARRYDLLRPAMQDRMHQPYRAELFPAMPALIEAALAAGAHGACLSGGGSTILALAEWGNAPAVGDALQAAAVAAGLESEVRVVEADREGVEVVHL